MCCVCETAESFGPRVSDPEFFKAYAQIEDVPTVSDFVVYNAGSDEEVRFKIRYCPMCGRRLRDRGM